MRAMKRRSYGRDAGLTFRMILTSGLLGLLYVAFGLVLLQFVGVGLVPMLLIIVALAFFQYYTSDKLALAAAGAKVVSREEAPQLHDMVERLCAMADLPKPKVAIMDTPVPNAFATGRSPKHAAVCVTTGLWHRLEPKEIEGVLAHELSHIANRDVLIMTVASFFAMLAAMLTRFGLYAGMFGGYGGGNNRDNNNTGPPDGPPGRLDEPRGPGWQALSRRAVRFARDSRSADGGEDALVADRVRHVVRRDRPQVRHLEGRFPVAPVGCADQGEERVVLAD